MIKYKIMKKLFYLLVSVVSLCIATIVVDAQEVNTTTRKVDPRTIFFKGDFFVGIGGGADIYFGENDRNMKLHHRMGPAMDLYVGKWIIPCLGVRVAYSGGQAFGLSNWWESENAHTTGKRYPCVKDETCYWLDYQEFTYLSVRGDLMLNVSTMILGPNVDRLYDVSLCCGIGMAKVCEKLEASRIAYSVGLFNQFRITKALDAVLDVHAMAVPGDFESETGGRQEGAFFYDGILTASVGVCYNF